MFQGEDPLSWSRIKFALFVMRKKKPFGPIIPSKQVYELLLINTCSGRVHNKNKNNYVILLVS